MKALATTFARLLAGKAEPIQAARDASTSQQQPRHLLMVAGLLLMVMGGLWWLIYAYLRNPAWRA